MNKTIGFICPLSTEKSEIRKRSDDIMENIIAPIAAELNYNVLRADKMNGNSIMDDIITMLRDADIIIADLTDMNPNVFYELGLRQATKGKCINIICNNNKNKIPFDIGYYRAYDYTLNGPYKETTKFQQYLKTRICYLEKTRWDPCMNLSAELLSEIYNITIVLDFLKGAKNHYSLAKDLFEIPTKRIFLMQRSSSLVLNAEQDWEEEGVFINNIKKAIDKCDAFYHIISIEGIEGHLERKNSVFPRFKDFSENVANINGNVAIRNNYETNSRVFYLRKLPRDQQNTLFKLDRQARVLITEDINGLVKAIIVQNLGSDQTCFLIQGLKAKEYLKSCIDYYNTCELIEWREIEELYKKYETIQKNRGK
jgi:hypothetical protein